VIGVPGSASLGGAIADGFDQGSVAPQRDHGLAFRDRGCNVITGLSSSDASLQLLAGDFATPEAVVWSGDGSLAVLFSRSGNWIQTVEGLPGAGAPRPAVDLSFLGGSLSAVAVDRSGRRVAIGITGDSAGVYLMTEGGGPVLLFNRSKPVGLAFSDDGSQLYAVDGVSLEGTAFRFADFTWNSFSIDGISDPIGIRPALDAANHSVLLVAGRSDRLLRVYSAADFEFLKEFVLDFPPAQLDGLGRHSLLLGTRERATDPLWLFTTNPGEAVYFVPAGPASGELQ